MFTPTGGVSQLEDIVLEPTGGVELNGMVTDEGGHPIEARITAWTMPPGGRRELGSARSTDDGRYRLEGLPSGTVVVRVEAAGYAPRILAGILSESGDVDFALSNGKPVERAAAPGSPAPELRVTGVNMLSPTMAHLKGRTVLLYFGIAAPPAMCWRNCKSWMRRIAPGGSGSCAYTDHSGYLPEINGILRDRKLRYPVVVDQYAAVE